MKYDGPRLAYRPDQLAEATGLDPAHIRLMVKQGVIPRMPHTGRAIVIPAWAVEAWIATGDWKHPDYNPATAAEPAAATAGS